LYCRRQVLQLLLVEAAATVDEDQRAHLLVRQVDDVAVAGGIAAVALNDICVHQGLDGGPELLRHFLQVLVNHFCVLLFYRGIENSCCYAVLRRCRPARTLPPTFVIPRHSHADLRQRAPPVEALQTAGTAVEGEGDQRIPLIGVQLRRLRAVRRVVHQLIRRQAAALQFERTQVGT